MPFAQAGDVKLHYETFGQGVPFLFVSGTGWPGEPWKLCQAPAFADRYQVIVYDHRGVRFPLGILRSRMGISRRMRALIGRLQVIPAIAMQVYS
jgi:pimeloyl-ACP methyl ester carboxylesterase